MKQMGRGTESPPKRNLFDPAYAHFDMVTATVDAFLGNRISYETFEDRIKQLRDLDDEEERRAESQRRRKSQSRSRQGGVV
jgi:hypothetical protein